MQGDLRVEGPAAVGVAGPHVAIGGCTNRAMDAATLYIVLTLPNGEQRTLTADLSTLWKCEQKTSGSNLSSAGTPNCQVRSSRIAARSTRSDRAFMSSSMIGAADRASILGHHHVRGALLTNGCSKCGIAVAQVGAMSGLSPTNAAEPEREPNVPDVLDMFGQPGLPRP